MLFVLHPLATESVVTAVGRGSVLAGTFVLAGLFLFLRCTRDESSPRYEFVAFSCVCFALGVAAHASALGFVLIVTAVGLCAYPHRTWRAHVATLFPCWFLFAALLVYYGASGSSMLRTPDFGLACYALLKVFAPVGLSAIPHFAPVSWVFLAVPLAVGVAAAVFKWLPGLAMIWTSGALIAGTATYAEPSERTAYLAVAGAVLLVPWFVASIRSAGARAVLGIACGGLVLAAGLGTYTRNIVWRDAATLWADAARLAPGSSAPTRKLGMTYLAQAAGIEKPEEAARLYAQARECLQQAIEQAPDDIDTREALGLALSKTGDADAAAEAFRAVLRVDMNRRESAISIARMLFARFVAQHDTGDLPRTIDYFRHADAIEPLTGTDLTHYGLALAAIGNFEAAEPVLERASLGNDSEEAEPAFKNARELARRVRGLMSQSAGLLAKNPQDPVGLRQRVQGLALAGQTTSAFYGLDRLMRAQPPDYPLWLLMGLICARMSATGSFLNEWATPPAPPEGAPPAWTELARTCAGSGLWDAARTYATSPQAAQELGTKPLLTLAAIALQFRQGARAFDYLNNATKAYPDDPEAWLRLCDVAMAGRDERAARNYLNEAKSRHPDPSEIEKREKALGANASPALAPGTIVQ